MKVIVVGCGTFGKELSYRLFLRGYEVTVVDSQYVAFNNLPADFRGRLCEGDAMNQDVLRRAGVENTDSLVAATGSDVLNMAIGHIAHAYFNVSNVIARNYEPNSRPLFETFGLQVVSGASWGVRRIEDLLYHNGIRPVFSAGNGEVEVYEISIPKAWQEKKLSLLVLNDALPVAITRAGRAFIPDMDTLLEEGDVVHVSATFEGIDRVRKQVCPKAEGEC
jgi:trk system potassium uptake protein